jgi:hypothetical protein
MDDENMNIFDDVAEHIVANFNNDLNDTIVNDTPTMVNVASLSMPGRTPQHPDQVERCLSVGDPQHCVPLLSWDLCYPSARTWTDQRHQVPWR